MFIFAKAALGTLLHPSRLHKLKPLETTCYSVMLSCHVKRVYGTPVLLQYAVPMHLYRVLIHVLYSVCWAPVGPQDNNQQSVLHSTLPTTYR